MHLTTELPTDRGISGGSTRQFRLLTALAQQGNDVTVVSPVTAAQYSLDPVGALGALGVRLIATHRYPSRGREALTGLRRSPFLAVRAAAIPYYALQTELLAAEMSAGIAQAAACHPDVVSIEHDFSVGLAGAAGWDVPHVLTVHNVTAAYYTSRASSSGRFRRVAYATEARRADRYIVPRLARFARLIAMSDADAALLRIRTTTRVDVVPNGTTVAPAPAPTTGPATVMFSGTMSHPPNREGIMWFHANVWSQVRAEVPDARLIIVGRSPQADVRALADHDPSVRVTGEVEDMTPYFAQASVVIAPLHSGGGTRLKILDAFGAERAVVSTTVGAEGLEVRDGTHLLLADDAAGFAGATIRLLTSSSLRRDLAKRGRQLADDRYSWDALGARLGAILSTVVEDSAQAGPPAR